MQCNASSKLLARAIAKTKPKETIAKMSKLGWYLPPQGPWRQRMNEPTDIDDVTERSAERAGGWPCQRCSEVGYNRFILERWLCGDCQLLLRETASCDEDTSKWERSSWYTWSHGTWTGNAEEWNTQPEQSDERNTAERPRETSPAPNHDKTSTVAPNLEAGATEPSGDSTTCASAAPEPSMCTEMTPTARATEPREGSALVSTSMSAAADIILLTDDETKYDRRRPTSYGGRPAHGAQQALRQHCLQNRLWCVTLNNDANWPLPGHPPFDWKRTLLGMPQDRRKQLIADGIVLFQFRLLRNVKDQNYPKSLQKQETHNSVADTGERHVFEITQCDGTKWHLHYHKNGQHDSPYKIPPRSSIWDMDKHDSPRWFSQQSIFQSTPEHNTPLGTEELCKALLKICPDVDSTRDITDMQAVHWHRWLQTISQSMAAMCIGTGIERVFAFSSIDREDRPVLTIVFAHPNNTYTSVDFALTKSPSGRRKGWQPRDVTHEDGNSGWRNQSVIKETSHTFSSVIKETRSWLRIPDVRGYQVELWSPLIHGAN